MSEEKKPHVHEFKLASRSKRVQFKGYVNVYSLESFYECTNCMEHYSTSETVAQKEPPAWWSKDLEE